MQAVQRSRRQITPSQKALEASGELQLPLKMEAALKSHTPPVQSPKKEASPLGPGQPGTAKPQEAAAKAEAAPGLSVRSSCLCEMQVHALARENG